jgi:3-hydroxyacyl-CoA dehydrogenase
MFVFKAAVVGAGTMGAEIAHVIANADIPVVLQDVDPQGVRRGLEKARSIWQTSVDSGRLELTEFDRKLSLITGTTSYDQFSDVDFVIEAVPERLELKHEVFAELDAATPGHAILASNTSALSITELGEVTTRPDKVVGFHFGYPASVSRMLEVIEGDDTSPETAQAAFAFAQTIRKSPIRCLEAPGFVINRILNAGVSEIWRYQEESGTSVAELDQAVTAINGAPAGPFLIADVLGLDTVVQVAGYLRESYGDRFYVHQQMRELVESGDLGVKTGRGFYEHGG